MTIPVYRFSLLDQVSHAISTRVGGVSPPPYDALNLSVSTGDTPENVATNRGRFLDALGVPPASVTGSRLYHGRGVTVFGKGDVPSSYDPVADVFHSDGVISTVPGRHFTLTFADCVPLLFADLRRNVVGAAHAGWRGTAQGIAGAVIETMQQSFGSRPGDIVVGIGPSIGPCCYHVGSDVARAFAQHRASPAVVPGTERLDLWESNRQQVLARGVPNANVEVAGICTSCAVDSYYSHRAEGGRTGRFAACIGLA